MISSNYMKARFRQKHDPKCRYSIPHHAIPLGRQNLEDILKKYPPNYFITERINSNDHQ